MKRSLIMLLCLAATTGGLLAATPGSANKEGEYYRILTLPIPDGIVLEAGALQALPRRRLAVSTRLGDIYFVEGAYDDPPTHAKFNLFASGLHEVLGLTIDKSDLYATQRGEVTRLKDLDNDGRADVLETVSDAWGIGGDYHEYAFGSKLDRQGNIWVTLCLTGSFTSENPYRGWCLRVNKNGITLPTASGVRSPGGMGTNHLGDMFFTDNQGPWNGTCSLKYLKPGAFMGHPIGNIWYKLTQAIGKIPTEPKSGSRIPTEMERVPQLVPPVVYFPYNKMGQSASGIACDASRGRFGPFRTQLFIGDQTHSTVMRVCLEKVNGLYQGALFPFLQGFASGCLSLEFGDDGSLFVGGTDRGWGSRGGKPFALQRVVWTGRTPFEIQRMNVKSDGFQLTFTEPVDPVSAAAIESYEIETYTYIYHSTYGSPEVDQTKPVIRRATPAKNGLSVRIQVEGLKIGHVHELHFPGIRSRSGAPLLHPAAYYTLNAIPK